MEENLLSTCAAEISENGHDRHNLSNMSFLALSCRVTASEQIELIDGSACPWWRVFKFAIEMVAQENLNM
ncbi:hypothetical protein EON64_07210 [archaeon]|nr:MAG: hypothetical protein EON64_07210 [archaeon]